MSRQGLGEFEQLILLALMRIGGETYGVPIVDMIERQTGRAVSRAAVYIALRRLETKGLVRGRMEGAGESPGKPRALVKITARGLTRLQESRQVFQQMWSGFEGRLERP